MASTFDPGPVRLAGERLFLAPLTPDDHQFLYWLSSAAEISYRWRFRGALPSYEVFVQQLQANVFAQFVARQRSDGERVGHVVAYAADLRNGHVFIANVVTPNRIHLRFGAESQILFIQYLFDLWNFHKIYVEIPEFTYASMQSWIGDDLLQVEGRLTRHSFYKGRFWDQLILALDRSAWTSVPFDDRLARVQTNPSIAVVTPP